ncbi:hypothetical protein [Candidatus Symbiopectobacterium sp.]|nr:hypothetical protein [Candidatus Symbiopectobacterium sp.]
MILRCEDPSFRWAASIKSIYSTKPFKSTSFYFFTLVPDKRPEE